MFCHYKLFSQKLLSLLMIYDYDFEIMGVNLTLSQFKSNDMFSCFLAVKMNGLARGPGPFAPTTLVGISSVSSRSSLVLASSKLLSQKLSTSFRLKCTEQFLEDEESCAVGSRFACPFLSSAWSQ